LERETRGQLRSRMNDSLDEMKNMGRTKQLVIAMAVANVMAVWMAGARAQTAEEGIANFYSDKFQGKKTGSGELYTKTRLLRRTKSSPTAPR
jgi:rare lipoprotein A (peptidoglycan hydrolase)